MSKRDKIKWTLTDQTAVNLDDIDDIKDPRSVRSLDRSDIQVAYQPIVEMASGRLFAYEALVRCQSEHFRNPIALFDRAVVELACGRLGRVIRDVAFERCPDKRLFVNIHPAELTSRWLVRPDDPIGFHDADVYLEITESAAFEYHDLCMGVLKEVCSRVGAHLVVDDFGAGHSNIMRILELEPKIVKFDRQLCMGLPENKRQQKVVSHLVDLCIDVGARVVIEGIETIDELKACQDSGAHYAQGYLIAVPSDPPPPPKWPVRRQSRRAMRRTRSRS